MKHLLPFFGARRAANVTSADIGAYKLQRLAERVQGSSCVTSGAPRSATWCGPASPTA